MTHREKKSLIKFGPNYLDKVGKGRRDYYISMQKQRAAIVTVYEQRFGPDWYSLYSEAKRSLTSGAGKLKKGENMREPLLKLCDELFEKRRKVE